MTLLEEIQASLEDLCADPRRREYAECAGLVPMTLQEEIQASLEDLCADPRRRDYAECAGLVPMTLLERSRPPSRRCALTRGAGTTRSAWELSASSPVKPRLQRSARSS